MRSVEASDVATNVAEPADAASSAEDEAEAENAMRARHSRARRSARPDGTPCAVRNAARATSISRVRK